MSNSSPMSRVKAQLDSLESALKTANPSFKRTDLNRRVARYFKQHSIRAIDKDYIRIYHSESGEHSFGIEFSFLEKQPEQWQVRLSVGVRTLEKDANSYYRYDVCEHPWMSFEEFKQLLKHKMLPDHIRSVDDVCVQLLGQRLNQACIKI